VLLVGSCKPIDSHCLLPATMVTRASGIVLAVAFLLASRAAAQAGGCQNDAACTPISTTQTA
jgi:hypothetical protein